MIPEKQKEFTISVCDSKGISIDLLFCKDTKNIIFEIVADYEGYFTKKISFEEFKKIIDKFNSLLTNEKR